MKPRKPPPAVAAAKRAMEEKKKDLEESRETVKRLEREYAESVAATRQAQEEADASLPQCRIVVVRWRSEKEETLSRAVILRRTPTGILVVRHVGSFDGFEYKFKWAPYAGNYRQAEKTSYLSSRNELRDVPAEYVPAQEQE